jgi:hypothetical protein
MTLLRKTWERAIRWRIRSEVRALLQIESDRIDARMQELEAMVHALSVSTESDLAAIRVALEADAEDGSAASP